MTRDHSTVVTPQMSDTLGYIPRCFAAPTAGLLFAAVRLFGGAPHSLGSAT